jgi:hypothetical protein
MSTESKVDAQHTPGPWKFDPVGETIYGYSEEGEVLVVVYEMNTNEADARLIAAAPGLLEALQNMVGQFDNPIYRRKYQGDETYTEAIACARAAITSATRSQG